jgi:hypothetical protein
MIQEQQIKNDKNMTYWLHIGLIYWLDMVAFLGPLWWGNPAGIIVMG